MLGDDTVENAGECPCPRPAAERGRASRVATLCSRPEGRRGRGKVFSGHKVCAFLAGKQPGDVTVQRADVDHRQFRRQVFLDLAGDVAPQDAGLIWVAPG